MRPRMVHWLYISIVMPSITFASSLWWPGCQTASAKKKLSRVQRVACLGLTRAMCTTPTNAVETLICLPPLELVVQSEARSAVHHLWSLGGWSYLHPNQGHSTILIWLQPSDPIFNVAVDVMRPAFNFEPKYRVTMRVGTLIVATIYLQLIQNRHMFRSFNVLQCSHQHCVQPVASDVEVIGYL